ncbi:MULTISPECIES: hypothetical protein [Pseudomonas]|uniref:hypothetical protein n=1 Tax=Pseudomonas TaxID=286 RepID=UPI00224AA954|nr:hypothetical protein [Pseudomonas sp. DCB_BI]MCX2891180.1 hypothetical protein [Pseudomonas sp. DCB_BI]
MTTLRIGVGSTSGAAQSVPLCRVHNGFGSSILPLTPIYARVLDNHFSASPLCDPTPERRLVLAFPADRPMSPANRVVQAIFAEVTQRLIDGQVWKARRP